MRWLLQNAVRRRVISRRGREASSVVSPPSPVIKGTLNALASLARRMQTQAATALVTTMLQTCYLAGPIGMALLTLAAWRTPRQHARLRALFVAVLGGLLSVALGAPLPSRPPVHLLRTLLIDSGLARLFKRYHSFRLVEVLAGSLELMRRPLAHSLPSATILLTQRHLRNPCARACMRIGGAPRTHDGAPRRPRHTLRLLSARHRPLRRDSLMA